MNTKIAALCLIVALACLVGCACPRADANGVITKNTTNCVLTAQDIVCNPSPEVLAGANVVLTLLKPVAASFIPGTAEFSAYVTAENIVGVGCSTLAGLNGLIAYLQSSQAKSLMMAKAGPLKAMAVSPQPFIDWRDGK